MNIQNVILTPINSARPFSADKPLINASVLVQKPNIKTHCPYVSPIYFHPSFCSSEKDDNLIKEFSNMLDFALENPEQGEKAMNDKGEEFFEKVLIAATKKKPLGEGKHGIVYRINEKYVFKIDKHTLSELGKFRINKNNKFDKLKIWYGKEIAHIGNISILRNANPNGKAITSGLSPNEMRNKCRNYYNKVYLPKCSSLPQKAFDDLAFDFKELNKVGADYFVYYEFDDENPNNFIIDNDSIKIVDEIYSTRREAPNRLSIISKNLINKYKYRMGAQFEKSPTVIEMRREILKKCILASERAELPLCNFGDLDINTSFELIGHDGKWHDFRRKLEWFREYVPNMEDRIEGISEEFDKLDSLT